MKREHGKHNKDVCDKLWLQDEMTCNDWVVTTSFYSSIHFLDHALFPCEYDGNTYKNINEAHSSIGKSSKHQTRSFLLNKCLPEFKGEYEFLISESQHARYVDYKINEAIARKAVSNLEKIVRAYDKDKAQL